jgi:hypothetical protein
MFKSFTKFCWKSKRRRVASVLALMLASAGVATAAFFLYSGLSGFGRSHVQGSSTVEALTFTPSGDPELGPGASVASSFSVVNHDATNAHQITTLTGVVSTDIAGCASFIAWDAAGIVGQNIPTGFSGVVTGAAWNVNAGLPASCAGAVVTVTLSGTTTP